MLQLVGRVDFVDLPFALDSGILKLSRVRGLSDQREGEFVFGQRFGAVRAVEIPGLGVGDVQLVADLVEAALLGDRVKQIEVDVGNRVADGLESLFAR